MDKCAVVLFQLYNDFCVGNQLFIIFTLVKKNCFPFNGLSGPVNGAVGIDGTRRPRAVLIGVAFQIVDIQRENVITLL